MWQHKTHPQITTHSARYHKVMTKETTPNLLSMRFWDSLGLPRWMLLPLLALPFCVLGVGAHVGQLKDLSDSKPLVPLEERPLWALGCLWSLLVGRTPTWEATLQQFLLLGSSPVYELPHRQHRLWWWCSTSSFQLFVSTHPLPSLALIHLTYTAALWARSGYSGLKKNSRKFTPDRDYF